jgi:DNA-binding MarR family transcriptional regulator
VTQTPRPARIGFLLTQLGTDAATRFAVRTRALGITPAQAGVLRILGRRPGISQRDLADKLRTVQSRVVALIDSLEALGLVVRERSTTDRRNYELNLTEKGRLLLSRLRQVAEAHETDITRPLSDQQRAELAALLGILAEAAELEVDVHPGFAQSTD